MLHTRRTTLSLEALEDRWVPATVRFYPGTLLISNPNPAGTGLTLTQTAANTFAVTDNGSSLGTYSGVSNINITGSNGSDSITLDLAGFSYSGSALVNAGNGNDTISITGTAMLGNATLLTGYGNDSVGVSASLGGSLQVISTLGNDSATLSSPTVGGDVSLVAIQAVTLSAPTFGGNVTIQDYQVNTGVSVTLGAPVTIGKNLAITTGSGADSIAFVNDLTVNGSTQLNLGNGADLLMLGTAPATTLNFNGAFNSTGGEGDDAVSIGGTVGVAGDMNFTFGGGAISFVVSTPFAVGGNFRFTSGNGDSTITLGGPVAGNMNFNVGNGNNLLTLTDAPSGRLTWSSGNGSDTVSLIDGTGQTWNVDMRFGSGDDLLNLIGLGTLTGQVDGGGRVTANTFNQLGFTLAPTLILSNFP